MHYLAEANKAVYRQCMLCSMLNASTTDSSLLYIQNAKCKLYHVLVARSSISDRSDTI
jgi:hypothetical protein